jgi:hypothetical protein
MIIIVVGQTKKYATESHDDSNNKGKGRNKTNETNNLLFFKLVFVSWMNALFLPVGWIWMSSYNTGFCKNVWKFKLANIFAVTASGH